MAIITATRVAVLRHGDIDPLVQTVQVRLQAGLVLDGRFGDATLTAVRNYQRSKGVTVDGVVGETTWAALGFKADTPYRYENATYQRVPAVSGDYLHPERSGHIALLRDWRDGTFVEWDIPVDDGFMPPTGTYVYATGGPDR